MQDRHLKGRGGEPAIATAFGCFLFLVLTFPRPIIAQVATSPVLGNSQTEIRSSQPGFEAATNAQGSTGQDSSVSPDVRRLHYSFKFDLRVAYDDNITLTSKDPIEDFYVRIDPVITIEFGDVETREANFFRFEYNPDVVLFFDNSNFDSFQHVLRLAGQSKLSRLTLGLSENAQFLEGSDVNQTTSIGTFINAVNLDVRGQPSVNLFNTQVSAAYELSGKTSLSAGVQWSVTDYSQFVSSQTVSGNLFINYIYSPKLTIGVGGTVGRELVDEPTTDQTFEQANLRASYELTGKLKADASAGVEFRQFDTGRGLYVSPVFDLSLNYTPFEGSTANLSGSRSTTSSASLASQDFISTRFTASWSQRFWQRFFFSITGGFENLTYFETVSGISSTRDDTYYFIQPAIDVKITRFWYAGGYYLHRQNDSSLGNFGFNENQVGLRTTFTF